MTKRGKWLLGVLLAGLTAFVAPVQAAPEHVANGGFETGDFTGWRQTGESELNGVQCPGPNPTVYAGDCSAFFGPALSVGGIEQSIDVGSAGLQWILSFAFQPDGGSPSRFAVRFGGVTLLSLIDPPAAGYTLYRFGGLTTAANMTLAFDFLDPPGFLLLDSVSLAVPEPATLGLMGAALAGLLVVRRRKTA